MNTLGKPVSVGSVVSDGTGVAEVGSDVGADAVDIADDVAAEDEVWLGCLPDEPQAVAATAVARTAATNVNRFRRTIVLPCSGRMAKYFWPEKICQINLADGESGRVHGGRMPRTPRPTTWEAYARTLGVALQKARMDRGITQEDLAHRAGLTRTHYQQIERGFWKQGSPANPSLKVLVRLAQVLDVEPGDLMPTTRDVRWQGE